MAQQAGRLVAVEARLAVVEVAEALRPGGAQVEAPGSQTATGKPGIARADPLGSVPQIKGVPEDNEIQTA